MEVAKTEKYERKMVEVEERAAVLQKMRIDLNREIDYWKQERERVNEVKRSIRAEALKHQEARDSANRTIVEIRIRVNYLRDEMEKKIKIFEEFDARLERGQRRLPAKPDVEEEIRSIEWEMMTTPTVDIFQREEILLERARKLKEILVIHEELDVLDDRRITILAEIKAGELEIRESKDEISRLKETSESNHESMILFFGRVDEERRKGDEAHKRFIELVSKRRTIDSEQKAVMAQVGSLREKVVASEHKVEAKKKQVIEQRKMEILKEVTQKLEAGKKLSLNELKLLYTEEEKLKKKL